MCGSLLKSKKNKRAENHPQPSTQRKRMVIIPAYILPDYFPSQINDSGLFVCLLK